MKKGSFFLFFFFLLSAAMAASDATISLTFDGFSEPSHFDPETPFTYKVEITQPTSEDILAFVVSLTFNPNYLRVVDSAGNEITQVPNEDFVAPFANCALGNCLGNTVDNTAGTLTVGGFWDPDQQSNPPSPAAAIFKIHFKGVQGTGNAPSGGKVFLDVSNSELVMDDGTNVIDYPSAGQRTLNGVESGQVELKDFQIAPVKSTGLSWVNQDSTANASIQLSWDANPEEVDPPTISYKIYREDKGAVPIATTDAGVTSYEDTDIDWALPTTTFTYQVSAVLNGIEGEKSDPITAGPDQWPPTPQKGTVTVTSVTDRSCSIKWQNDEAQVKAKVKYSTDPDVDNTGTESRETAGAPGSTTSSVTVTGLSASTTYYYKVQATDRAGNTLGFLGQDDDNDGFLDPNGTPFTCVTSDQPPTKPSLTSVQCTVDTDAQTMTFTWNTDIDADSRVCISSESTTSKDCADYLASGFSLSDPTLQTSHTLTFTQGQTDENGATIDLKIGTNYSYLVISNSLPGEPTACNGSPCEGTKTGKCQYGEALQVTSGPAVSTTTTTATISWTTNKAATAEVCYSTDQAQVDATNCQGNVASPDPNDPVTDHTVTLTGLTEQTTYYYQVRSDTGQETVVAPATPGRFVTQQSIAPKGSVSVKVSDESGNPVAGATVELRDTGGTLKKTAVTDSSGSALMQSVDIGGYTVTATKSGYSSASKDIQVNEGQTTSVSLTLREIKSLGDLEVTVLNKSTGEPIANALVSLDPNNADPATTGSDGIAFFDNLPAEIAYTVKVTKEGFFDAQATTDGPILGDNEGTVLNQITVEMQEAGTIKGTVVQSAGGVETPISGIAVFPSGQGVENTCAFIDSTDENGAFTINVPEGSYEIKVLGDSLTCGATLYLGVLDLGFNVPEAINVGTVKPGEVVTKDINGNEIKFALSPRYVITITPPDPTQQDEPISVAPTATINFQTQILQGGRAPDPPITSLKWKHSNPSVGGFLSSDGSIQDELLVENPGSKPSVTFVLEGLGTTDITIEEINGNRENVPLINNNNPVRVRVSAEQSVQDIAFTDINNAPIKNRPLNPRTETAVKITYKLAQQKPTPKVTVRIFKQDGTLVQELLGNESFAVWDYKDGAGRTVPNGVYLVQVVVENPSGKKASPVKLMGIFR